MIMEIKFIFFITLLIQYDKAHSQEDRQGSIATWPIYEEQPCIGVDEIVSSFIPGLNEGYKIIIKKELPPKTVIKLKFDSEAYITFEVSTYFILSSGYNSGCTRFCPGLRFS